MKSWRILINPIVRLCKGVCFVTIIFIMLLICADAITTKLFGTPIYGTIEIVEELTAILALFSLTVSETERGHLNITILSARLSQKWSDILVFFGYLVGFMIMCILCWRSVSTTIHFVVFSAAKQVTFYFPLWPSGVLLSMAALSFTVVLLYQLIDKVPIKRHSKQL